MTIISASALPGSYSSPKIIKKDNDVLCGRGGLSNNHRGNFVYRRIVNANKDVYKTCHKPSHKHCVVVSIITAIHRNGGRFIERKRGGGGWQEISSKKAIMKTSQALRESHQDKFSKGKHNNPELRIPKQKSFSSNKAQTVINAKTTSSIPTTLTMLTRKISDEVASPTFPRTVSDDTEKIQNLSGSSRVVEIPPAPKMKQGIISTISSQESHPWIQFV